MNKQIKLIYWISTSLFSVVIAIGIGLYLFQYPKFSAGFKTLGYPAYLIYPLCVAKFLGLVAIWQRKINWLKEWAYAGFFFNLTLALTAHFFIGTNKYQNALIAMSLLLISFISEKYIFKQVWQPTT
ncbi:MAG TPA: hypothetical protein DCS93_32340 [Microscillaceae bacterium]|nr:hypothetical protein [Microscillaceae bacterium]